MIKPKITVSFSIKKDEHSLTWYCYPIPLFNIWYNDFSRIRSYGFSLGWLFWNLECDWTFAK